MRPLLALDFDGVICDSLDECLVSAVNARRRLQGEPGLLQTPDDIDGDLVRRFRRHRHVVRGAGEYETLLHWLETRGDAPTTTAFSAAVRQRPDEVAAFQPVFFAARAALRDRDAGAWTALHRRYLQATAGWDALRATHEIHVVTTKDLTSVRHFNAAWRLELDDDRLHTCERSADKATAVRRLAARRGAAPGDVTFVDDHPLHLEDVAATGARCLWASWGYTASAPAWPALTDLASLPLMEGTPA